MRFIWDAPQFHRYGLLNGFNTFKTGFINWSPWAWLKEKKIKWSQISWIGRFFLATNCQMLKALWVDALLWWSSHDLFCNNSRLFSPTERSICRKIFCRLHLDWQELALTSKNMINMTMTFDFDCFAFATLFELLVTLKKHVHEGCPRGVMVKLMDRGIVESEFELQLPYYVHFWTNTLGKDMNPLSLQLWVEQHHRCFSRRMVLALNNPRRLTCH